MSSPAPRRTRLSSSRTSLSGRKSLQGGPSSLPQAPAAVKTPASHSRGRADNVAAQTGNGKQSSLQPTYDLFTGAPVETAPQPLRQSRLRQPSAPKPDATLDENVRARINALEYELKNVQQERGLLVLQHEKELRDQQLRAEADFKKYQAAESSAQKASQRQDALARDLGELQDQRINETAALERKLRDLQDVNAALKDEADDARERLTDQTRHYQHQLTDAASQRDAAQATANTLRHELADLSQQYESAQTRLAEKDGQVESLDVQVTALKAHASDGEALIVLQTQLSEQVSHIRQLEATNREQLHELRRLRDSQRSVQVVEEQKHGLEVELQVLKDVERQLGEAQIQREILEDEKRMWTSLLDRDGRGIEFDSPEAVVRALIQLRIEHASVLDRVGSVETDLAEKDEIIKALDADKAALKQELDQSKSTTDAVSDRRAYQRLDRQRALAVKEVEYLRAQLKTFDTEETVLMDNATYDPQRSAHITQLETLVDQYKAEVQTLHADMAQLEARPAAATPRGDEPRGTKRPAETQEADGQGGSQLGALLRKNKNLQTALQKTAQQSQMLATDLQATKAQLKALRESSKTRVLELRDNPTAQAQAVKMTTLRTLKEENAALLAQVRGEPQPDGAMVPSSSLDALKLDLADMEMVVADKEKRMRRQREIWTQKAAEFRDVIASVLGYTVNFLPNGKAKVSSLYYGKPAAAAEDAGDSEDEAEDEHHIVFDGDHGTMKISGGPDSPFGADIKDLVNFWVKEKKQIPCFLAAMTLEFYEKFAASGQTG